MSQDNVLKKEFAKKDVERLRNLMQGKYGDKNQQLVLVIQNLKNSIKKAIFGTMMVVLGLLKMALNKILLN